jgi:hypothetical protein
MDIDALAKKFAKYEPMLQAMFGEWDAAGRPDSSLRRTRTENPDDPTFGQKIAAAGAETISPALHAEIHAPIDNSPEAIEARRQQHIANETAANDGGDGKNEPLQSDLKLDTNNDDAARAYQAMRTRFDELGSDQVRTLLLSGDWPAAWHDPATQWLAENPNAVGTKPADASQAQIDERTQADAAVAKAEEDRLRAENGAKAEHDRAAAEVVKNAAAAGQNRGQAAAKPAEGGNPPENAGKATSGASLGEVDYAGSREQPKG